jgi:hypothetical protein
MNTTLKPLAKCTTVAPPANSAASPVQCSADVQALRLAKLRMGASAADIAQWCDVDRRTVERWLAGERPIQLAALIRSRRLFPVFSECLDEVLGKRAA